MQCGAINRTFTIVGFLAVKVILNYVHHAFIACHHGRVKSKINLRHKHKIHHKFNDRSHEPAHRQIKTSSYEGTVHA